MKKILFTIILVLVCQAAYADLILLKNGTVVEGKIIQVRGIFVRILDNYDSPFKEFLIEDIINIEQSSPDEVSQLTIRNIHQRAINRASSRRIQEAVDKRATELLEEAIQSSEVTSLDKASDKVKKGAQKKASAIIEEAILSVETPLLSEISAESKIIAEEKAGSVIEQAVKIVEVFPLQKAPDGVQIAAKKAASVLIGEAVMDAKERNKSKWLSLTVRDQVIGGALILLLVLLFREKRKNRTSDVKSDKTLTSSLKEIDEELKKFDQTLGQDEESEEQEIEWTEKRVHNRAFWNFPVSLSLDGENNPIIGMVKDISLGGAYAVCNDISLLRALGDKSQFRFNFSSKDPNFPINGKADVVRIRSNRGLGLKFSNLDKRSISYLKSVS